MAGGRQAEHQPIRRDEKCNVFLIKWSGLGFTGDRLEGQRGGHIPSCTPVVSGEVREMSLSESSSLQMLSWLFYLVYNEG